MSRDLTVEQPALPVPATSAADYEAEQGTAGPLAASGGFFSKFATHIALILLVVLWSIPTMALLVSSFREPGLRSLRRAGGSPDVRRGLHAGQLRDGTDRSAAWTRPSSIA